MCAKGLPGRELASCTAWGARAEQSEVFSEHCLVVSGHALVTILVWMYYCVQLCDALYYLPMLEVWVEVGLAQARCAPCRRRRRTTR